MTRAAMWHEAALSSSGARTPCSNPPPDPAANNPVWTAQFAIGSAILSDTPAHHSHMAHSLDTLAAANTVLGNTYRCAPPVLAPPQPQKKLDGTALINASAAYCNATSLTTPPQLL